MIQSLYMLDKTLSFLKLIRNFENVHRMIYRPDDRRENDVEHSYQLAMMAWFLSEQFNLSLSKEKLFKYGLAHDLVEVYAGDTPAYAVEGGINTQETKKEREARAFEKIKQEFGYFHDLMETIELYEHLKDDESLFIYELDKILPPLNIYLDDGYGWNKFGITLDEISVEKRRKVTHVRELVDLLKEMLERFEKEKGRLFVGNG